MLKKLLITTSTILSLLLLNSCGNTSEVSSTGDSNNEPKDEVITVWIPGDEVEYGFYFDMFENYKNHIEANGGTFQYSIEQQPWSDYWTKLPLEVNKGRGPDMYLAHDSYMDVLLPISKELDLGEEILETLNIKGLYTGENGKDKFVPTVLLTYVMYANTDIVGNMVDFPTNWSDFEALAKEFTNKDAGIIGYDFSFNTLEDLQYDDKVTFTKDDTIQFYDKPYLMAKKWEDEGISDYFNFGNGSPEKVFNENAVAFIHGATWMEFWAPDDVKERMVAFPVPKSNDGGYFKAVGEPTFGINKNLSDEKFEICNDIIKFMLSDEETLTNIVKANSGVANNQSIIIGYEPFTAGDAVTKSFETGKIAYSVLPSGLEDVIKSNLEGILMDYDTSSVFDNAKVNLEGVDISRLLSMEDAFRGEFK